MRSSKVPSFYNFSTTRTIQICLQLLHSFNLFLNPFHQVFFQHPVNLQLLRLQGQFSIKSIDIFPIFNLFTYPLVLICTFMCSCALSTPRNFPLSTARTIKLLTSFPFIQYFLCLFPSCVPSTFQHFTNLSTARIILSQIC